VALRPRHFGACQNGLHAGATTAIAPLCQPDKLENLSPFLQQIPEPDENKEFSAKPRKFAAFLAGCENATNQGKPFPID